MKSQSTWRLIPVVCLASLVFLSGCPEVGGGHGDSSGYTLNDTGITTCADDTTINQDCPVSGFPKQDAEVGHDKTNNDDSDGHAGFSFTKINSLGYGLPASATSWDCVKDNITGLMWEVKTSSGLHNANDTYTWYSGDSCCNGGIAGTQDGGSCFTAGGCDTEAFVAAVNAEGLCGHHDWRLPNIHELMSLADYSWIGGLDYDYFPNEDNWYLWSSDSGINAKNIGPNQYARCMSGTLNIVNKASVDKSMPNHVRLVR